MEPFIAVHTNIEYTSFFGHEDFGEDSALGAANSSKEENLSRLLQIQLIGFQKLKKNKNNKPRRLSYIKTMSFTRNKSKI